MQGETDDESQEMKEDIPSVVPTLMSESCSGAKGFMALPTGQKWRKPSARDSFRARFQNITRIMDCVTCDKCVCGVSCKSSV